ncbi:MULTISPECIES: 23S rRNA (adenine(1618)-N(6))-methyltransferase RlmF [unclassified Pseudoalteromonas]|uniref:23S rRNA (adenine(1618)-N(6))-methyltransferase RlmF n=1 Tax=unclassified Pseudoalteromonas TaxID=194690 RepID=UPI0011095CCC|nr:MULTISPECIES: 23S rRNA (adenine(1618)-N(6))-methyltransferase RlmF [unclassified Pseudoalteromonas]TMN83288.1 23S rRNA (adenine(1618)-N(6))-methyltransferase RlmF [Pseudoalteromonas sp. S410]TMN90009.1 23S rRNA (adenine(1618)-N(6))-methyltransferase RlmF [Pseudoalteromonas sp. S408]TMN96887.1 23S rRNA (adenine(1618)-N(6))-methyltransferase RlmF [Pseudoalteromonas sp. S409]TMN96998.1 23S rRNA (adenine(1618)-N(6))-methyltransferase RlmF [Pseudoalteromonas sp. S407]TMO12354.1 23S rRNA (adenine
MTKNTPRAKLHPRNQHNSGYDFELLTLALPALCPYIVNTPAGTKSIDFANNKAVKTLNQALLKAHYNIEFWDIPVHNLCPPIPGRVDYIHYLADLLSEDNQQTIPRGKQVKVLDIGTGANLVYPLTGTSEYKWHFTGSDIDPISIKIAKQIAQFNALKITLKLQKNSANIFKGVINQKDLYHLTLCNPPFHASEEQANKGSERKWKNLGKSPNNTLNFGGNSNELWCEGGEVQFITTMIAESEEFAEQVLWFTSLISKKDSLIALEAKLKTCPIAEYKIIEMAQGQKVSRFIAWSYFDKETREQICNELD